VGVGISDWVRESHIHGLVLSIPLAGDRASPLGISMFNLRYLYLTESNYSIKVSNSTLNKLYMTCDSLALNILAKWLVHLKDLRNKTLVINEPFDESIHIKYPIVYRSYRDRRIHGQENSRRIHGQIGRRLS
jgi:hypothetical protein